MTWDFFMLVVVAYSIFYTLLAVSFSPTQTDEIVLINWIVTICFGIDLFLSKYFLVSKFKRGSFTSKILI